MPSARNGGGAVCTHSLLASFSVFFVMQNYTSSRQSALEMGSFLCIKHERNGLVPTSSWALPLSLFPVFEFASNTAIPEKREDIWQPIALRRVDECRKRARRTQKGFFSSLSCTSPSTPPARTRSLECIIKIIIISRLFYWYEFRSVIENIYLSTNRAIVDATATVVRIHRSTLFMAKVCVLNTVYFALCILCRKTFPIVSSACECVYSPRRRMCNGNAVVRLYAI